MTTFAVRLVLWTFYVALACWLNGIPLTWQMVAVFVGFLIWGAFVDGFVGRMRADGW
jgi:hypothetical protein